MAHFPHPLIRFGCICDPTVIFANGTLLERKVKKLPSDIRFNGNDKVATQ